MRDEGPVRTSRTRLGTNRQTADSATSELEGVVSDYNLHVIVEVTIELVISNRSFQVRLVKGRTRTNRTCVCRLPHGSRQHNAITC